ncbi:substrate-binding domain-containing protein [candidate division KSB1 bacterium]|nr:substrate-binding domain-containing protein [candidate division KSB1 bacterium]
MSTMREIATQANVSVGTVDRVFHNRGRVAEETRERILKIAKELNYRPNPLARSLSRTKGYHFGVIMPEISEDNHYWELAISGIKNAETELDLHRVKIEFYTYDGYSDISFINAAQKSLQDNLDGLLIVPTIFKTIDLEFIKQIPPNLPYVFFNSTIPDSNCLSYIGQDSFQSGYLSGKLMHLLVNEKVGTIAIITILPEDYHINERAKGFQFYFSHVKTIRTKSYGLDRREDKGPFQKIINTIFSDLPDLQGVFITTALTYRVAEYLKENDLAKRFKIVGYDLTDKNVEYLREGLIDILISQKPEIQGYEGIYTLFRHVVLKKAVQKEIMMPLDIIMRENINYYQHKYLFH